MGEIKPGEPTVLAHWVAPPLVTDAERVGRALLRAQERQLWGVYALLGVLTVCIFLFVVPPGPGRLVFPAFLAVSIGLIHASGPRRAAAMLRKRPGAADPTAITLDVEGVHTVGSSSAVHLRWNQYKGVRLHDGVLILRPRAGFAEVLVLDGLDPAVDRQWLVGEVQRLIAAQVPG